MLHTFWLIPWAGISATLSLLSTILSVCDIMTKLELKKIESRHDKTNKVTVRPAKTRISLASSQSD